MTINDPNFSREPLRAHPPARPASSASTWYLVTGAAVLLMVLYLLTTGMMRGPLEDGGVPGSAAMHGPAVAAMP